jgi:two-component system sensor histidine kinase YesM
MKQVDYIAYTVMFSSWVQDLIDYRPASIAEELLYHGNVQRFLQSLSSMNNNISLVLITNREMIFSNTPQHYYDSGYDITKQSWFSDLEINRKHIVYGDEESRKLFGEYGDTMSVTLFYMVTDTRNFTPIGYFAINIPLDKFGFLLNDFQYDWIEIIGSKENIIFDEPSTYFASENGSMRPDGHDWISHEGTLMDGHLKVRLYRRISNFMPEDIQNYYFFLILLVPVLWFFVIITFLFSRYLTNPIVRCRNAMQEIQNNNFGITLENHYRDEIGGLIEGFNEMSRTLVTLRQENIKIDKLRWEAEIDMLQQKVNPHFLYNTLEIINALIMEEQYTEAVQVCELLGQIYHYNLMSHRRVYLKDEIEYVKQYLKILQYKVNNLSVVWEISDEVMETDCLKLILQPLVENAVRHGLRSKRNDACLSISARVFSAGRIEIQIMDNGSGIQPDVLSEIEETLSQIRSGVSPDTSHVGISNVYQRLYLEYGHSMTFVMASRPDYGTKVTVVIPGTGAALSYHN